MMQPGMMEAANGYFSRISITWFTTAQLNDGLAQPAAWPPATSMAMVIPKSS